MMIKHQAGQRLGNIFYFKVIKNQYRFTISTHIKAKFTVNWHFYSILSQPLFPHFPPDLPGPCWGCPGPRDLIEQLGPRPWEGASTLHRCGTHRGERGGERRAALASREHGHGGRRRGPVFGAVHPTRQHCRLGRRGGGRRDVGYPEPAARLDTHWWVGCVIILSALPSPLWF